MCLNRGGVGDRNGFDRIMSLLVMRWRAEVRSRWRSLLVLCLLVGLGGGMALTALAGARRADTAVPRFVAYSRPGTGTVFFGTDPNTPPEVTGPRIGTRE